MHGKTHITKQKIPSNVEKYKYTPTPPPPGSCGARSGKFLLGNFWMMRDGLIKKLYISHTRTSCPFPPRIADPPSNPPPLLPTAPPLQPPRSLRGPPCRKDRDPGVGVNVKGRVGGNQRAYVRAAARRGGEGGRGLIDQDFIFNTVLVSYWSILSRACGLRVRSTT